MVRDTVSLLRDVASRHPTADAFVDAGGRRLSFSAWDRAADGVAAGLAELGVGAGDVVCLLLGSSLEYAICYQAAMRLGAVTSGVNTRLGPDEIAHILGVAAPRLTITPDDERVLPTSAGTTVPWSRLAPYVEADRVPMPNLTPDQPVVICWTGGTTGRPKGVWFDHDNLAAVSVATGVLSERFDRRLSPVPFAHVGTMTRAWDEISHVITTVITPVRWTAADSLRLIEAERVTVAQGVPTQWELMLRSPTLEATDLSSLRIAATGAARVTADLLRRMRAVLGVPVINRYASTEAGGVISGSRPGDPDEVVLETVGRPSDGVEIRVAGDDGEVLPVGGIGRVQVRSGAVMRGYWRDPEGTAAVLDADGWVTVGDVGRLDADGNLTLVGRDGERYLRGGYNVYPVEVERVLSEHPDVGEVAVVGVPDPVLGEIGFAFVVPAAPDDPARAPLPDDLRTWVGAHLADYKVPDRVVVLGEMPLTSVGKIDRRTLAGTVDADG